MITAQTKRPHLVQSERTPKPTPEPGDYEALREYHRRYLRYGGPERNPPQRMASLWFPAKLMALGFVTVLASMMVIPSLKMFYPAVVALFTFAGALNLAIVLPLAMMIIGGKAGGSTGRLISS